MGFDVIDNSTSINDAMKTMRDVKKTVRTHRFVMTGLNILAILFNTIGLILSISSALKNAASSYISLFFSTAALTIKIGQTYLEMYVSEKLYDKMERATYFLVEFLGVNTTNALYEAVTTQRELAKNYWTAFWKSFKVRYIVIFIFSLSHQSFLMKLALKLIIRIAAAKTPSRKATLVKLDRVNDAMTIAHGIKEYFLSGSPFATCVEVGFFVAVAFTILIIDTGMAIFQSKQKHSIQQLTKQISVELGGIERSVAILGKTTQYEIV